ncbi:MAG: hypothetical protein AB7G12_01280 [Thermoanaerobaculia bacterium]
MINETLAATTFFDCGSIRGEDVLDLVASGWAGFRPRFYRTREQKGKLASYDEGGEDAVRRWDGRANLELRSHAYQEQGMRLWLLVDERRGLQTLMMKGIAGDVADPEPTQRFLSSPGFRCAYLFDEADVSAETARYEHSAIPSGPAESPSDDTDKESDSLNQAAGCVGRESRLPFGSFIPAWKCWFGPKAQEFFPGQRLLDFPDAECIREVASSVIFLQLFEHARDAPTFAGRERQGSLRRWLGVDALEAVATDTPESPGGYSIETGDFEHGGVRRVTIYSSLRDGVVRPELADQSEIFEIGPGGAIVWRSGTRPVRSDV